MLTCMLRVLLVIVIASQIFGCTSYHIERGHHISVDEEGRARGRVTNKIQTASSDTGDFTLPPFASFEQEHVTDQEFQTEYITPILDKIEKYVERHANNQKAGLATQQAAQILLFIHGGLNSYEGGLEHIKGFLEKQKDTGKFPNLSSYFLLSLNWEAGLESALKDHFFHIRFGERSTFFATATFPIVLLHDLGESIVKAPDAIYSEAKDLFQNQSADFLSVALTTASLASIYGLPIAALHPTWTIAGMMPTATYTAAGVAGMQIFGLQGYSRYAFGPIRMASAPFIEGFGTPAWDMLKRRPDLLLFNPTTKKDGAMGELLKALTGKIKNGKWQTKECEYTPDKCLFVELTLVGHSMGAMVSDRILTTLPKNLPFKHIIYLGAANSIADFKASVIPYLRGHSQTEFWSFALSEVNESSETYAFDLLSRGSLLVWIDLLFERTYGLPQRRFGREVNQESVNIDEKDIWQRICRISFSSNPSRQDEPRKHGDFTKVENVELVLRMVKNGCPVPAKLMKDRSDKRSADEFRQELKKTLQYVPRITTKSIAAIADNAPYSNKIDLDEGEFLSEQSSQEIGNYLAPIDINTATTDELALILRGDRHLARQIFEHACDKRFHSIEELEARIPKLVSTGASQLIHDYGTFGTSRALPNDSWLPSMATLLGRRPTDLPTCALPGSWRYTRHQFSEWWSNVRIVPVSRQDRKIREASDRYNGKVKSEIKTAGMNTSPVEETSIWNMLSEKNPWDVIINMDGQRAGIKIYTWAGLEQKYFLKDQESSHAQKFADTIKKQADDSNVHAVIFVTNEDVFSKESMAKATEAIQNALGEKFYSVHGLPKTIPEKIKSVLQRHTKERMS